MKVVFRADASMVMGTGHIIRCLALAEGLRKKGVEVQFVTRGHRGNLVALLRNKNILVNVLPAVEVMLDASVGNYADWLGVSQSVDAQQTIDAIAGDTPDWIVVDHYALDIEWEQQVRCFTRKILVIDDLANRLHDCDVLFDQNYAEDGGVRYQDLVGSSTTMLLGPDYALLNDIYAEYRKVQMPRDGIVKRVQVYFGGSDPHGLTMLTLQALSEPELVHLAVEIITGINYGDRTALEQLASVRPNTSILTGLPHLAEAMVRADLAIGAGGTTIWERMCLGLPSIVISVAENQRPGAENLAKGGFLKYVGHYDSLKCEKLRDVILAACSDSVELTEESRLGQLQVDGLGVPKLAELLFPSEIDKVQIRQARADDIFHYFRWANDPTVRVYAHNPAPISWANHKKWFTAKICSESSWLFVMEVDGVPFGQIRFDEVGEELVIGYSLAPVVRGRGLGMYLVAKGVEAVIKQSLLTLRADVLMGNAASLNIFRKLGFSECNSDTGKYLIFRKQPSDTVATSRNEN